MLFGLQVTSDLLGSLAIAVSILTAAIGIGLRLGTLQQLVQGHTSILSQHADRLDRYEETQVVVGERLARMIGRVEATQNRIDFQTGNRSGEGNR
jgi:argonaute-like protein implicated in RNA metabolism and viral defense